MQKILFAIYNLSIFNINFNNNVRATKKIKWCIMVQDRWRSKNTFYFHRNQTTVLLERTFLSFSILINRISKINKNNSNWEDLFPCTWTPISIKVSKIMANKATDYNIIISWQDHRILFNIKIKSRIILTLTKTWVMCYKIIWTCKIAKSPKNLHRKMFSKMLF
jgi:hypothetical protein